MERRENTELSFSCSMKGSQQPLALLDTKVYSASLYYWLLYILFNAKTKPKSILPTHKLQFLFSVHQDFACKRHCNLELGLLLLLLLFVWGFFLTGDIFCSIWIQICQFPFRGSIPDFYGVDAFSDTQINMLIMENFKIRKVSERPSLAFSENHSGWKIPLK